MALERPKAVAEFGLYVIRSATARALGRIAAAGDAALDCWDGETEDSRMYNRYYGIAEAPAASEEDLSIGESNV